MRPPIFELVNVTAVQALLRSGGGPLRFYAFGEAPQDVRAPYAVWQLIFGSPENYLGGRPDIDNFTVQVDVYGKDAESTRNVQTALRDALELSAHITSWRPEAIDSPDLNTRLYRAGFDVDFWTER